MLGAEITVVVTEGSTVAESEPTLPVAIPAIGLEEVEQLKANSILLTFNQDATGYVSKENIKVEAADGTLAIPINKLTISEDGLSAVADLSVALTDGKDYDVTLNDSTSSFTASVGSVASIAILTVSAVENEKTDIEFALYDEEGIDVTSTVNLDARCTVTVDGDGITSDTSKASASTITMSDVDDTAVVTVTYNSGKADAEDIEVKGTIICIEAEAKLGDPLYADISAVTAEQFKSECAKFYNGIALTKPVTVEVDKTNDLIFFCATDENGDVISYDKYEIESSDDDTVSVSTQKDNGKFAEMTISGNKPGSASIVITATANGKDTAYTIPVTVTQAGKLNKIEVTLTRATLSNAYDEEYYGEVKVTAYDTNGNKITGLTPVFEIVNKDTKEGTSHDIDANVSAGLIQTAQSGFQMGTTRTMAGLTNLTAAQYSAWNDQGGTQNIKVSVSQDDILKEKTVGVSVNAIPAAIWRDGVDESSAKLTYAVDLVSSTLTEGSTTESTEARLAASYSGRFVGYVRQNTTAAAGNQVTVGTSVAATETSKGVEYLTAPDGSILKIEETTGTTKNRTITMTADAAAATNAVAPTGSATMDGLTFTVTSLPTTAKGSALDGLKVSVKQSTGDAALSWATSTKTLSVEVVSTLDITQTINAEAVKTAVTTLLTGADLTTVDASLTTVTFGVTGTYSNGSSIAASTLASGGDYVAAVPRSAAMNGDDLELHVTATTDSAAAIKTLVDGVPAVKAVFDTTALANTTETTDTYVAGITTTIQESPIVIDPTTALSSIKQGVKYGTKYSNDGKLYNSATNVTAASITQNFGSAGAYTGVVPIDSVAALQSGVSYMVSGDSSRDFWFAKPGSYTVIFDYTMNGKPHQKATTNLTVKNGYTMPKVNVTKRVVDSLTEPSIIEVLTANVDMNNNTSTHESITELVGASTFVAGTHADDGTIGNDFTAFGALNQDNNKVTVKYAVVQENDGATVINFLVPINATFRTE